MAGVRVFNDNLIDRDVSANITASSANASFPVSNIYNKIRRSKPWRSDGYWEITSANNGIVFEETSGIKYTVSVLPGNYASTTSFLAAIKTAMDSIGASTYTVTQDTTTLKIKITSNGLGGAGIFNLKTSDAGFTLGSVIGFSSAVDLTGSLTYTADTLKIHTSEFIKIDCGLPLNIRAVIICGPDRNGTLKISQGATVKIQGNNTDNWTAPTYDQSLTWDDELMIKISSVDFNSSPLRYWRIYIVDPSNSQGFIELGTVFIGNYFEATRGAVVYPLTQVREDNSERYQSENGTRFHEIRPISQTYEASWEHLTKTELESLEKVWLTVGTYYPFFMQFDPNVVFSSSEPRQIKYLKLDGPPSSDLNTFNNFSMNWSLREDL